MPTLIHNSDILRNLDGLGFFLSSGQNSARSFKRQSDIVVCEHDSIIGKWAKKNKGLKDSDECQVTSDESKSMGTKPAGGTS
jgi:hypothetical protein